MYDLPNWLSWSRVAFEDGKSRKVPVGWSGYPLKAWQLPQNQMTVADAMVWHKALPDRHNPGFAFSATHPIACIDVDIQSISPEHPDYKTVLRLIDHLKSTTYWELSPSGAGLHFIGYAFDVLFSQATKILGCVDIFVNSGFVSVTGNAPDPKPLADITKDMRYLISLIPDRGYDTSLPTGTSYTYAPERRTYEKVRKLVLNKFAGSPFEDERDILSQDAAVSMYRRNQSHKFRTVMTFARAVAGVTYSYSMFEQLYYETWIARLPSSERTSTKRPDFLPDTFSKACAMVHSKRLASGSQYDPTTGVWSGHAGMSK